MWSFFFLNKENQWAKTKIAEMYLKNSSHEYALIITSVLET